MTTSYSYSLMKFITKQNTHIYKTIRVGKTKDKYGNQIKII
jgi:hypothetical protein